MRASHAHNDAKWLTYQADKIKERKSKQISLLARKRFWGWEKAQVKELTKPMSEEYSLLEKLLAAKHYRPSDEMKKGQVDKILEHIVKYQLQDFITTSDIFAESHRTNVQQALQLEKAVSKLNRRIDNDLQKLATQVRQKVEGELLTAYDEWLADCRREIVEESGVDKIKGIAESIEALEAVHNCLSLVLREEPRAFTNTALKVSDPFLAAAERRSPSDWAAWVLQFNQKHDWNDQGPIFVLDYSNSALPEGCALYLNLENDVIIWVSSPPSGVYAIFADRQDVKLLHKVDGFHWVSIAGREVQLSNSEHRHKPLVWIIRRRH